MFLLRVSLCIVILTLHAIKSNSSTLVHDLQDFPEYRLISAGSCLTGKDNSTLSLRCGVGEMLRIVQLYNGYSNDTTRCLYTENDCTMDVQRRGVSSYPCIGSSSCDVIISASDRVREIPSCKKQSTYIQALYHCIPDAHNVDICSTTLITSQRGHLRSPGYPTNYTNSVNCSIRLMAPHMHQRFKVYIIDFHLEPNNTGCSDYFEMSDGHHYSTMCGSRVQDWTRNSTQNFIDFKFCSNERTRYKGFWLYFEAFPLVKNAMPKKTIFNSPGGATPMTVTTPKIATYSQHDSSRLLMEVDMKKSYKENVSLMTSSRPVVVVTNTFIFVKSDILPPPLVILLGIVVALLVTILLVLLFVVCLKRNTAMMSVRHGSSIQTVSQMTLISPSDIYRYYRNVANNGMGGTGGWGDGTGAMFNYKFTRGELSHTPTVRPTLIKPNNIETAAAAQLHHYLTMTSPHSKAQQSSAPSLEDIDSYSNKSNLATFCVMSHSTR